VVKVLVIADRNPHIDVAQVVRENHVEMVITLGDLTREDILGLADVTHIPKIGVYGNHDSGSYMEELGIMDMHRKTWQFGGLSFGGFEGCVRYKDNPDAIMYTQTEATEMMRGYPKVDVFISHCPPRGVNDEPEVAHQGFDALRTYLDAQSPAIWLHGHTYPTDETIVRQVGATRIEYVFGHRIVEL
jgi:Icc-related predicted phosphoesterase